MEKTCNEYPEEFENEYFYNLEREWLKEQPRFTDLELLSLFSDVLESMDDKVAELKTMRDEYVGKVYEMGKKYVNGDDIDSYFASWLIQEFLIKELQKVEKSLFLIQRLRRLKNNPQKRRNSGITPEEIQQARQSSIVYYAEQHIGQLKKNGVNFSGKCPFHEEKTPSFYIYTESNRFYCFGCGATGDVITFMQKIASFTFKEAVYYLIKK